VNPDFTVPESGGSQLLLKGISINEKNTFLAIILKTCQIEANLGRLKVSQLGSMVAPIKRTN